MSAPERTTWPDATQPGEGTGVAVVTVNSNTRRLVAQLVFSLYRLLGRDEFAALVLVDNASVDGSRELLRALQEAGLATLLENDEQRYHGPALTQAVSWLAAKRSDVGYVWLLDSDVVVLRADTVRHALRPFADESVAMVGEAVGDPGYDRLLEHNGRMLQPTSLLFDPARVWQQALPPFVEDGAPAVPLQVAADGRGLTLVAFPFVDEGYIVHLGRGTLRALVEAGDSRNRYYEWARTHHSPHFSGAADGPSRYRRFGELFDAEVPVLDPKHLVAACTRTELLSVAA